MTSSITSFFDAKTGKETIRANHHGPNGASSQTCATVSEARAFIAMCDNRKPAKPTDMSYRDKPEWINGNEAH